MTPSLSIPRIGLAVAAAGALALAAVSAGQADTGLPDGRENTVVLVQNTGNSNATIVLDIYTRAGQSVPEATREISGVAPGGIANFEQATNTGVEEGFRGVGVLSSDQSINALLVRDILVPQSERPTERKSYSLAQATNEGGHVLAAPMMFNQLESGGRWWNSRVSLVNVGTEMACVEPTYTLLPGIGGATGDTAETVTHSGPGCNGGTGFPVDPGAQLTLSPEDGDTNFPGNTFNNQMSGLFEVTNPSSNNKIAAVVDVYRSDGIRMLAAYNALVYDTDNPASDDVGTDVVSPIAMKSTSGFYTVISVTNMDPSQDADVEIEYIGNLNNGNGAEFTHTVDLGSVEHAAFHSTYDGDDIPVGFMGYAKVTSDQDVGVSVIRGKLMSPTNRQNEPMYTAVNGVPEMNASTSWSSPLYFRRFGSFQQQRGYNSWFQVQVPGGGSANLDIRYVGDPTSGCPTGPYELNTTVTDSQIFYANDDSSPSNGFPANAPNCFFGGLEVESDVPVIVVSQVGSDRFPGGDAEGLTNSFPGN